MNYKLTKSESNAIIKHVIKMVIIAAVLIGCLTMGLSACAMFESEMDELTGSLRGNTFTIDTFDHYGNLTLRTHGEKIDINGIIVEEMSYNAEIGWTKTETMSSALDITIDGHQMVPCGDTLVFYADGLTPDYTFDVSEINSSSENFSDNTAIAGMVNSVKNSFGKPVVVIIKTQTGIPIYAFSGKDVYWKIPEDLPKMTLLSIDGKPIYIHRANYQIIDLALLED